MAPVVYLNPRCSKCRRVREILEERGVEYELVEYLETPPDRRSLEGIARRLEAGGVRAMVRSKEPLYAELGLENATDEELLDTLARHPRLLERPIVVSGERAVVARPPERVLELL